MFPTLSGVRSEEQECSGVSGYELKTIRVGVTEWHGMAQELASNPPEGIVFSRVARIPRSRFSPVRSPIKGFMPRIESTEHDIVEAVISPVITENLWIYSLAHFAEAVAFNMWGIPVPRAVRLAYVKNRLMRDNCKKIIFWSQAGLSTFTAYGRVKEQRLVDKATVVYPGIREVPPEVSIGHAKRKASLVICFGGDFFRKGGANLVDAFERAQKCFSNITLRLCCDQGLDFNTADQQLRRRYLERIRRNTSIVMGRVTHERMIGEILPQAHIYALPTSDLLTYRLAKMSGLEPFTGLIRHSRRRCGGWGIPGRRAR